MKTNLLLLVFATVTLCVYGQPAPPVISESFTTHFRAETKKSKTVESIYYVGEVYSDFAEKKYKGLVTTVQQDKPKKHDWTLDLYKTKETYSFEWEGEHPTPTGPCRKQTNSGVMEAVWAWTRTTKYNETITYENHHIEIFTTFDNETEIAIGVDREKKNIPYFTSHRLGDFYVIYYYHEFDPTAPPAHTFTVPGECDKKAPKTPFIKH